MTFALVLALAVASTPADSNSVYRVRWEDGVVIGAGLTATALPYAFSASLITESCPCDKSQLPPVDRWVVGFHSVPAYDAATALAVASAAAPFVLDFLDVPWSAAYREDAVVFAETLSFTAGVDTVIKYIFQRPLPISYTGESIETTPGGYRSFWSGHTAVTVSALTAFAMTHGLRKPGSTWPWFVALGATLAVGTGVIAGGRHFPTDVAAGLAAGALFGTVIPFVHERERNFGVTLAPLRDGALGSVSIVF